MRTIRRRIFGWPALCVAALAAIAVLSCRPADQASRLQSGGARPFVRTPDDPALSPAVYMKSASVMARLRPADKKDLPGSLAGAAGGQSAPNGPFVVAEIDCYFEMEYDASAPTEDFGIVFPVFEKSDPPVIITKFEAWTDGVECREIEPADVEVADPSGRSVVYDGYGWPSPPPKGKLEKSRVKYTMLLPVRQNRAKFTYVVRSGGTWAKPIGQETVAVEFSEPLQLSEAGRFKPASRENGRWTWMLKDARPTDDVEAFVDVASNRKPEGAK